MFLIYGEARGKDCISHFTKKNGIEKKLNKLKSKQNGTIRTKNQINMGRKLKNYTENYTDNYPELDGINNLVPKQKKIKLTEEEWSELNNGSKGSDDHIADIRKMVEVPQQEIFVSKGSDECQFEPTSNTSSATICKHCGREKFLHTT